ncbi:uncharacterized protein LOC135838533 [Planococcus citri]|uniref:uncharacterized protein LOC135838533 n=1 Tax=Planococcus citri TaxID=170843 RepID=UPI0031F9644D
MPGDHTYRNIAEEIPIEEDEDGNLTMVLADGSDELLVDLVKSHTFIYSKVSPQHKDAQMKVNAWTEIAEVLQISAKEAEHRWGLIRDKFTRERKIRVQQPSGSGKNAPKPWALYEKLSFLNEHVKRRKTTSTVPTIKKPCPPANLNSNSNSSTSSSSSTTGSFRAPKTSTTSSGSSSSTPNTSVAVDTGSETDVFTNEATAGTGNFRKVKKSDPLDQDFSQLSAEMLRYYRDKRTSKEKTQPASEVCTEKLFGVLVASELKKMPESIQKEKKKAIMAVIYE